MGDFSVRPITSKEERNKFYHLMLEDISVFEEMLAAGLFQTGIQHIGAEQELCLLNQNSYPSRLGEEILNQIQDPHYTNELALFNLEINLDPFVLTKDCFSKTRNQLERLLKEGQSVADQFDTDFLLAGILPTIQRRHLNFEFMTPIRRYRTISNALSELRGSQFEIYLQGVDELIASLDSVLFEACNTSFQTHLQVEPDEFVDQYNWAQMISGPVLSASSNSPLLMGRQLWSETRIALFKQSLDTRSSRNHLRVKMPRVDFGNNWIRNSAADLYKEKVANIPLIVVADGVEHPREQLSNGIMPSLKAIGLHMGTTYSWNRLCYGIHQNIAHLRIECRYLPSGPSVIDEIANFAFWVGLMKAMPENPKKIWLNEDFQICKENFFTAARYGLDGGIYWNGKFYNATQLINEQLLPMAEKGLNAVKIDPKDIHAYLSIIEQRALKHVNGATWQVRNFRRLKKRFGVGIALREITKALLQRQKENRPVHEWEDLIEHDLSVYFQNPNQSIEKLMRTELFTLKYDDCMQLVKSVMEWENIRHLPIEDYNGSLVGIVTKKDLDKWENNESSTPLDPVDDYMSTELITANPEDSILKVKKTMDLHGVGSILITSNKHLMGLITRTDLAKIGVGE